MGLQHSPCATRILSIPVCISNLSWCQLWCLLACLVPGKPPHKSQNTASAPRTGNRGSGLPWTNVTVLLEAFPTLDLQLLFSTHVLCGLPKSPLGLPWWIFVSTPGALSIVPSPRAFAGGSDAGNCPNLVLRHICLSFIPFLPICPGLLGNPISLMLSSETCKMGPLLLNHFWLCVLRVFTYLDTGFLQVPSISALSVQDHSRDNL